MGIIIVQPTLPAYRTDFFDRLYELYGDDLVVYHSALPMGAVTSSALSRKWPRKLGHFLTLFPGLEWQRGVAGIRIGSGDIVIVPGAPRNISNLVLLLRAKFAGARTIWWGHYWSSTTRFWRFYIRMILMRLAHAVLFYTDAEVEEYKRANGGRDQRLVAALNNGINIDPIKQLRTSYRGSDRPKRALFIGRLTRKSGLPLLLKALAYPEAGDAELDTIGNGELMPSLKDLAHRLGIADRVVWHGETVDEQRIARIANRSRAFVYPGEVGLSLIHAMAYGLPAIIHSDRRTQMPEFAAFSEGVNGWSFRRGDAADLAAVLGSKLDSTDDLDLASSHAVVTVERSFNTERMAENLATLISQLSSRP